MRKESTKKADVKIARVQGYHEGGYHTGNHEGYAFLGFSQGFNFYTSDRYYPVTSGRVTVGGKEKLPDGYGLEVETECNSITNMSVLAEVMEKIIFPNFKFPHMWKMQHDGSLGGDTSVECITGIMTRSRIRNDWPAWKALFDCYMPNFRISADSYSTSCGMHVNVSLACLGKTPETQEEASRKLFYIINKHYNIFRRAFYRASGKTHWCGQMDYTDAKYMNIHNMPNDHSKCLNYSHYDAGRVEIRLIGGQKDFDTFRKTMEVVFHLVDRVQKISWADCDDINQIFKGCNQYVLARLENIHVANDYIRNNSKFDASIDCLND